MYVVWASVRNIIKVFADIRAIKIMNMCQILTMYLNGNKNDGKKTVVTVEPGTGSS